MSEEIEQKEESKLGFWEVVGIILLVVIGIILFIITLGYFNPAKSSKSPEEFKSSRDDARSKYERFKRYFEDKIDLKKKLERKFKLYFFLVRVGLIGSWIGVLVLLYSFGLIKKIDDVINYSQGCLLLIVTLNFLTFGSIKELNIFIDIIRIRLKNFIYGKHIDIDKALESDKSKLNQMKKDLPEE